MLHWLLYEAECIPISKCDSMFTGLLCLLQQSAGPEAIVRLQQVCADILCYPRSARQLQSVVPACMRHSDKCYRQASTARDPHHIPGCRFTGGLSAACKTVLFFFAGLYQPGDWLMFGAETSGLPKEVSSCTSKQCIVTLHRAVPAGQNHTKTMHHDFICWPHSATDHQNTHLLWT